MCDGVRLRKAYVLGLLWCCCCGVIVVWCDCGCGLGYCLHQVNVWDMKDLGYQASQRIIAAKDPLRMLREISQNFPLYARSLSRTYLNNTLKTLLRKNRDVSGSNVCVCVCVRVCVGDCSVYVHSCCCMFCIFIHFLCMCMCVCACVCACVYGCASFLSMAPITSS